jgi:hypothetical protein
MDQHLKQDTWIEDRLKSQPLAPMPHSITADVMARLQTTEVKRPTFLTWSDFVVGSVIGACIAALWFATQNLPPLLLTKLRIQGILLYQDFLINSRWLIPTLLFGFAALMASLTIPTLYKMTVGRRR